MFEPYPITGLSVAFAVGTPTRAPAGAVTSLDPLTLAEAKRHLNVTHREDDVYIDSLITACRDAIEEEYGAALLSQTITATFRGAAASLELPIGPVQSVTSATRTDDDGDTTDAWLTADLIVVDRRVSVLDGSLIGVGRDSIEVVYTAGFGDSNSDVPPRIRHGILTWVADLYTNRGTFDLGSIAVAPLPGPVRHMLSGLRRYGV